MAPVVFRNGEHLRRRRGTATGRAVVVEGDRILAVVGSELAGLDVAGATEVDLAGGLLLPGFVDAHVHPVQGGLERVRCDLSEAHTREDYLRTVRGVRRRAPRPAVDPRRWLGDGRLPRRHADRGRPRRGGPGPPGLPAQPRPPRRLGEHPGDGDRRHRPGHPRPRARPVRARRRRSPDRHPARGRDGGGVAALPAHHGRRELPGPARGPALPALARRHRLAGRDPRRVRRRPTTPRRRTSGRRPAAT